MRLDEANALHPFELEILIKTLKPYCLIQKVKKVEHRLQRLTTLRLQA